MAIGNYNALFEQWLNSSSTVPATNAAQGITSPTMMTGASIAGGASSQPPPVSEFVPVTFAEYQAMPEGMKAYYASLWDGIVPLFLQPSSPTSPPMVSLSQQPLHEVYDIPPPPINSSSNMSTKKTKPSVLKQGTLTPIGRVNASTIQPAQPTKSSKSTKGNGMSNQTIPEGVTLSHE